MHFWLISETLNLGGFLDQPESKLRKFRKDKGKNSVSLYS